MNSGVQLATYIAQHPELVSGKVVTDMGTGCGIQGIVAALLGAQKVYMADIDMGAVANAQLNVIHHDLEKKCEVFQGDLFANYGTRPKSQVQIFNHPYFSAEPIAGKDWTRMMLGGTELLGRYLAEVPLYSTPDCRYILSWLPLAGNLHGVDNDPAKRASAYGFEVVQEVEQAPVSRGLQRHPFIIYELIKSNT
ncbi:50S ribosomal protein L11 methyltransferase [Candidatus Woesearchaeota archaeon]|nr:50S ribosomal protein L11 methyltransferase [Candidatus Woesearchaeota archaeon]